MVVGKNNMSSCLVSAVLFGVLYLVSSVSSSILSTTTEQISARTTRIQSCLQNCANCVQFWEHGLYNGGRCAKLCVNRRTPVVDPDCNNIKMFNIDLLLETQRNQQQLLSEGGGAEQMMGDQPTDTWKSPKKAGRLGLEDFDNLEEETDNFRPGEVKARHGRQGKSPKSERPRHHQHRHKQRGNVAGPRQVSPLRHRPIRERRHRSKLNPLF